MLTSIPYSFTFHHVSIKTANGNILDGDYMSFTFHHVSIKTISTLKHLLPEFDSHSTMYLLKRG